MLECYFLITVLVYKSSERMADSVYLRLCSARIWHMIALVRKRRHTKENDICLKTGPTASIFCDNVSDRFYLVFASKINMDERKKFLSAKHSLLVTGLTIQATFVCSEL